MTMTAHAQAAPPLGSTKDAIDTPALCLDLDALDANIADMMAACRAKGVAWRPHAKGHKSPDIAQRQLAAGALGITVAKLGEAEVMAAAGVRDILIANMIVGPLKLARLVALCRVADPIVCVDHLDQIEPLSAAMSAAGLSIRVIIEVDIGLRRVGVPVGEPTLALAREILKRPGLRLAGVMGYEGHLLAVANLEEKAARIREVLSELTATADLLRQHDIPCEIVSCAGTGSYMYAVEQPGVSEIQAGGAIFMDIYYRTRCQVPDLRYALTVLTTIVSRPTPERAIIDSGRKTLSMELIMPEVAGRDDVRLVGLNAEHGALELAPSAQGLKIGDRIELIPGYGDLTCVLHDEFYCFRNGRLEAIWPIAARGKLR
ncbi:MAG TPA: DSD1 family PLP-dependent enzyme [Pirellulales bacterium]